MAAAHIIGRLPISEDSGAHEGGAKRAIITLKGKKIETIPFFKKFHPHCARDFTLNPTLNKFLDASMTEGEVWWTYKIIKRGKKIVYTFHLKISICSSPSKGFTTFFWPCSPNYAPYYLSIFEKKSKTIHSSDHICLLGKKRFIKICPSKYWYKIGNFF